MIPEDFKYLYDVIQVLVSGAALYLDVYRVDNEKLAEVLLEYFIH